MARKQNSPESGGGFGHAKEAGPFRQDALAVRYTLHISLIEKDAA